VDVAIGSMGSSILATKVLHTSLPWVYWIILPLCVWIIYTSDHLLDAAKLKENALMERHAFHFKYRRSLTIVLGLTTVLTICLILSHLTKNMILFGCCTLFVVVVYLLTNHFANRVFKFFPREIIVAAGYIAGTWGIPLMTKYPFINRTELTTLLSYFLIILCIPLLYSMYEYEADKSGGFISFATTFGIKITGIAVWIFLTVSIGISLFAMMQSHHGYNLMMIAMAAYLLPVLSFQKKLIRNENYRVISDSVNMLPFLLLII